jgi:hypothetical protein
MKKSHAILLAAAIAASAATPASATVLSRLGIHKPASQQTPASEQTNEQKEAKRSARKEGAKAGFKGGAKGCVLGGLASLLGGGDPMQGCVIGGISAGVSEGVKTYQEQMKDWQEFQRGAVKVGAIVKIETKEVAVKNAETGKVEKATAPKSMTVSLLADDVAERGKDTKALLKRTASLADASKVAVTITVNGSTTDRGWMMGELRSHLRADTTATLRQGGGKNAELVLTPAPQVGE